MAILGTAYVEIRAITKNLENDLSKAFNATGIEGFGSRIAVLAPLIAQAVSAVSALASGLFAMASAAAPAVASLAALPGILAAIVQGAGVLALAFSGVSRALSAGISAQSGAGGSAAKTAKTLEDAAARIGRAQDALTQTIRRNAESQMLAQRAVADAEANYAKVRKDTADAIKTAIQKQHDAVANLAKTEQTSADDRIKAQQDLLKAQRDVENAVQDQVDKRRKAQEAVDTAQKALDKEIANSGKQQLADQKAIEKAIINAAQAQNAYVKAQREEQDALDGVTKATNDLTAAREKASDRIRDLQTSIAQGVVDEKKATEQLQDAAKHLQEVQELPPNNRLRKDAQIAYDQAVVNLKKVQNANEDLQQQQTEAAKTGVEGSKEVVDATDKQKQAQQKYQDAIQATADKKQAADDASAKVDEDRQKKVDDLATSAAQQLDLQIRIKEAISDQARTVRDTQQAVNDATTRQADLQRSTREQELADEAAIVLAKRQKNQADSDYTQAVLDRSSKLVRARRDETDAERNLSDTKRDNALSLKQAQEALDAAKRSANAASAAGASGTNAFQKALNKLSPAAREFVMYLLSIQDRFKELKQAAGEELFPKLITSIKTILSGPFFPALVVMLRDTGSAMGDLAIKSANLLSSPAFTAEFTKVTQNNIKVLGPLGDAILNLVDGFVHLLGAAGPLTLRFAEYLKNITGILDATIKTGESTGKLEKFFTRAGDSAAQLGRIVGNLVEAIFNVGSASVPAGQGLLDSFEQATNKLKQLTGTQEARKQLHEFFDGVAQNVRAIGNLFNALFLAIAKMGDNPGLKKFADDLRTRLLPPLENLFNSGIDKFGGLIVTLATSVAKLFDALSGSPAIAIFVTIISTAIDVLTNFVKNNANFVFAITGMLAAFKAFALITNILLPLVRVLFTVASVLARLVLFGNPVVLVIGLLVAGFTILYLKNKTFHDFVNDRVLPVLIKLGSIIKDTVITAFTNFVDFITHTLVPGIQNFFMPIIAAAEKAFVKIGKAISDNSESFSKVGALFKVLAIVVGGVLFVAFKVISVILTNVVLPAFKFLAAILLEIVQKYLTQLIVILGDLIVMFIKTAAIFIDEVSSMVTIVKNLPAAVGKAVSDIIGFFAGLPARIKNNEMFKFVETAMTSAKNWVSDRVDDIVGFVASLPGRVNSVFSDAFKAIRDGISTAKDWVSGRIDDIVGFVASIPGRIASGISDGFKAIGDAISSAATTVSQKVGDIVGYVIGIAGELARREFSGFKIIGEKVGEAATAVKNKAGDIADYVMGIAAELVRREFNGFKVIGEKISSAASTVSEKAGDIVDYVEGIGSSLLKRGVNIFKYIGDKISDAYDTVKGWVGNIADLFGAGKGALGSLISNLGSPFGGLVQHFRNAVNGIIDIWNNLHLKLSFPSIGYGPIKIPGFDVNIDTPNIPHLATGGTVAATSGGVLALLGEAGRSERVTPLGANGLSAGEQALLDAINALATKLTGRAVDITNNVYPRENQDEREVALLLSRRIAYDVAGVTG